jgi:hypothetical protein
MPLTKEEAQERALLVRQFEAACKIEHPTSDELNFRIALMKSLGRAFNLKCVRDKEITGPVRTQAAPAPVGAKR